MADANSTNDAIANIGNIIAAVAALGTASMGLVDASKAIAGGPSNLGFGDIQTGLATITETISHRPMRRLPPPACRQNGPKCQIF